MDKKTIQSINELSKYLKKQLRRELKIEQGNEGDIFVCGTYKDNWFYIIYQPLSYLLFSTKSMDKEGLDKFKTVLSEYMMVGPICYYELLDEGKEEKEAVPTFEWDLRFPKKRICEIVNGYSSWSNTKCINLKLFNNEKISDYQREKEPKVKVKEKFRDVLSWNIEKWRR